eukprot:TRINITY_DN178_c0_g1_i1.p1 TRINITY_DN178_c0_g1~~TRINITY_DN178_c0_g1_i1.p1  ORF type:complete len:356 (-),score=136.01 TRINITY_DN178_c0_g1_i1:102-1169(-)
MSKMEYRFLGRTGLRVSALSLGAWITLGGQVSDGEIAYECMKAAFERGCNFFDNAEVYCAGKAEVTMGKCIKRLQAELGVKRSDLVISTKIFWGGPGPNDQGLSRKHIIEGTHAALERLQLDYVDLLYCHRPDQHTPIEETVRAMNYLINTGKAFYWGTSEWSASEILQADEIAKRLGLISPMMEQPQYSMLHRKRFEAEYAPVFEKLGYGSTIWSPLASGLLTGKYSKDPSQWPAGSRLTEMEDNIRWLRDELLSGKSMNGLEISDLDVILTKVDALRPIAAELGISLAQMGIAWAVQNKNVSTVITGATKVEQVIENFKVLEIVPKLTPEILAKIEKALDNKPTPATVWRRNM